MCPLVQDIALRHWVIAVRRFGTAWCHLEGLNCQLFDIRFLNMDITTLFRNIGYQSYIGPFLFPNFTPFPQKAAISYNNHRIVAIVRFAYVSALHSGDSQKCDHSRQYGTHNGGDIYHRLLRDCDFCPINRCVLRECVHVSR